MTAPVREVGLGPLGVALEQRADGCLIVRSTNPITLMPANLTSRLAHWATATPDRVFLAERDSTGNWHSISYAETLARVRSIASALLARDLSPERPIVILSGNSIAHALLGLAALHVGIPYAPISPAYALGSTDHGKLRHIIAKLTPGLVFADDGDAFAAAIESTVPSGIERVTVSGGAAGVTCFAVLAAMPPTDAVAARHAEVGPDTVAKILFTSGSTGTPKGVVNTQRMLCRNQVMLSAWMPFHVTEPPVLVDWLPWNHTFGGNHNLGLVLWHGGTLHIDAGRPLPGGIAATARNLAEISPTIYFNVPKGYEALLPHLRTDKALRANFFRRLRMTFYSGANLAPDVADALDELAVAETGRRILMVTGFGSTETAPAALVSTEATARPGVIGLPLPGITLKLVPADGKLEARLLGETMTPGYWREPEQTAAAFDAEGFYRVGDAMRFASHLDPEKGMIFDGRIAEDFKLSSGTWVSIGPLRQHYLAGLAPLAREMIIAGHDRDSLTALVLPDLAACRALAPELAAATPAAIVFAHPAVRAAFAERLRVLAERATGSSTRIARLLLLDEPPSVDAGEITDKGSINQRAVLTRRAGLVDALYADPHPDSVIVAGHARR